jgi:hypothetical protein
VQLIEAHDDIEWLKRGAHHDDLSWWYRQYGNRNSYPQTTVPNWGLSELKFELPNFDYPKFREWLSTTTYETILSPPLFQCEEEPIHIKAAVVINGEVHLPIEKKPEPVSKDQPKSKRKNRRGKKKPPHGKKQSAKVGKEVKGKGKGPKDKRPVEHNPIVVEPAVVPPPKPARARGKAWKIKFSEPPPPD